MTKQPYLTDFPRTILANSQRRLQAGIRRLRDSLRGEALNGYAVMFSEVLPASFLREIDPTLRNRHFGCLPVFWTWFAQILEGNASCSKAIALIQNWCRSEGLPIPSTDTSSYCKGRARLCDGFLGTISKRIDQHLQARMRHQDLRNGMVLKAIDGSSVNLADTEASQQQFPQPSGQKPGCGFPVMAVAGILNLSHGGWDALATGSGNEHDLRMARSLTDHLVEGDLLLADRAYCSYTYIAALRQRGVHVLMRLHQKREASLDWKKGKVVYAGKSHTVTTAPGKATTLRPADFRTKR